jgi:hypothetical protein
MFSFGYFPGVIKFCRRFGTLCQVHLQSLNLTPAKYPKENIQVLNSLHFVGYFLHIRECSVQEFKKLFTVFSLCRSAMSRWMGGGMDVDSIHLVSEFNSHVI